MLIKVDFYANGFRSATVEIPDALPRYKDSSRIFVEKLLMKELYQRNIRPENGGEWEHDEGMVVNGTWRSKSVIKPRIHRQIRIITAKIQ